jgi:DHA3 family macrolide efflux protein-like MFS transporter
MTEAVQAKKLWNFNFILLWQGQLVSELGNAVFTVALGFWVLEVTGSTAIMGIILALFTLPKVVFGPLAGAFADRANKKLIIVFSDLIRGIFFTAMGLMIIYDVFPFGLMYPFALLISFFGAFFGPAINAAVPDIVDKENLTRANSARGICTTASQLVGFALGGLIYALVSGPVFFVMNGVSFIYSALTEVFIHIPNKPKDEKKHILHDMSDGFRYSWRNRGIKILLLTGMFINFFVTMGVTLLQPLFLNTPGFGIERYGYTMGSLMSGSIVGMLILSLYRLRSRSRFFYYRLATFLMIVCMLIAGTTYNFTVIMILGFFAGIFNSIIAIFTQTVLHITVPQDIQGKVFGIKDAMIEGLSPIAMALSGIVAHFLGVRPTLFGSFMLAAVVVMPSLFNRTFIRYMNSEDTIHQGQQA